MTPFASGAILSVPPLPDGMCRHFLSALMSAIFTFTVSDTRSPAP